MKAKVMVAALALHSLSASAQTPSKFEDIKSCSQSLSGVYKPRIVSDDMIVLKDNESSDTRRHLVYKSDGTVYSFMLPELKNTKGRGLDENSDIVKLQGDLDLYLEYFKDRSVSSSYHDGATKVLPSHQFKGPIDSWYDIEDMNYAKAVKLDPGADKFAKLVRALEKESFTFDPVDKLATDAKNELSKLGVTTTSIDRPDQLDPQDMQKFFRTHGALGAVGIGGRLQSSYKNDRGLGGFMVRFGTKQELEKILLGYGLVSMTKKRQALNTAQGLINKTQTKRQLALSELIPNAKVAPGLIHQASDANRGNAQEIYNTINEINAYDLDRVYAVLADKHSALAAAAEKTMNENLAPCRRLGSHV